MGFQQRMYSRGDHGNQGTWLSAYGGIFRGSCQDSEAAVWRCIPDGVAWLPSAQSHSMYLKYFPCQPNSFDPLILPASTFFTWKYAGIRKISAKIHAAGLPKQTPVNPNEGTNAKPASVLAAISKTPAKMAKVGKPIPCIRKRTMFTNARGK